MKKIYILLSCFLSLLQGLCAQEEALFNQYRVNRMMLNPACVALGDRHQFFAMGRNQWVGLPGQPQTMAATYNGPVTDNVWIGGLLMSDELADMKQVRAQGAYARWFKLPKGGRISAGLSAEFHNYRLRTTVLDNPLNNYSDIMLADYLAGVTYFDASAGIYAEYNRWYGGISFPNMVRTRIGQVNGKSDGGTNFIFLTGYRHDIAKVGIEPYLQVRRVLDAPFQADLGLRVYLLKDILIGGVLVRPAVDKAVVMSLGTSFKNLQIHYAYEYALDKISPSSKGIHELVLGVAIARKKPSFDRNSKISD